MYLYEQQTHTHKVAAELVALGLMPECDVIPFYSEYDPMSVIAKVINAAIQALSASSAASVPAPFNTADAGDVTAFNALQANPAVAAILAGSAGDTAAPVFTSSPSAQVSSAAPTPVAVAAGGTPTPAIALATVSPVNGGITLTDNGNGTASINTVLATTPGTYSLSLNATNSVGTATQAFTLVVGP